MFDFEAHKTAIEKQLVRDLQMLSLIYGPSWLQAIYVADIVLKEARKQDLVVLIEDCEGDQTVKKYKVKITLEEVT